MLWGERKGDYLRGTVLFLHLFGVLITTGNRNGYPFVRVVLKLEHLKRYSAVDLTDATLPRLKHVAREIYEEDRKVILKFLRNNSRNVS